MDERQPFDLEAYVSDIGTRPCFICELIAGNSDYRHHVVHRDDDVIIFLSKHPTLRGYCLVCPIRHVEDLAEELVTAAYLALQARVHRLARVLKQLFGAERIYVLSLGSQQANRHLHFHVVPLPPGIPLERQQYHALMAENGVLQLSDAEMEDIARRIADAYGRLPQSG